MALERQNIEKRDFPIGRRGYDPDAVDAHLAVIADAVEELKTNSRRRSETLATAASEQVRAIVEAAEASAADIQRQAEDEARETRAEAAAEAQSTREHATGQAREYVGKVSEATSVMLQRIDAMESELGAMIEALRTGARRLQADLELLGSNLADVGDAVALRPRFEPESGAGVSAAPAPDERVISEAPVVSEEPSESAEAIEHAVSPEPPLAPEGAEIERATEPVGEAVVPEPAAAAPAAATRDRTDEDDEDAEAARLIALNMALSGTPREETDRYLADNFDHLADRGGLLDDVYASLES